MKINWLHKNMVNWRMVVSCVVSKVSVSRSPEDKELFLINAIFDPVEVHIHILGSFNLDGGISETGGGGVIRLY